MNLKDNAITSKTNYYQITVFKENNHPFFFNVMGDNIDFDKFSKDNLQFFINELFIENAFSPIIITNRKYYLDFFKNNTISVEEEMKFNNLFNSLFNKKSKRSRKVINLNSGEQILIKGVSFKGLSLIIEKSKLEYEQISIYPPEIYSCETIKKYYVPLKIDCIEKLKK